MQIVIDIYEEDYERVVYGIRIPFTRMLNAIRKGTLLPKGHGRLIDADALILKFKEVKDWEGNEARNIEIIQSMPTMMEAEEGNDE